MQSKKSEGRERLARKLDQGQISQRLYNERSARESQRGRGSLARHGARVKIRRALRKFAGGLVDAAQRDLSIDAALKRLSLTDQQVLLSEFPELQAPAEWQPSRDRLQDHPDDVPWPAPPPAPAATAPQASARKKSAAAPVSPRAKSFAKQQALLAAQAAAREATERRWSVLTVPAPFKGPRDFLQILAEIAGKRSGGRADLGQAAGVDRSTMTKWLSGRRMPPQPKLDLLVAWWRSQLGDDAKPIPRAGPGAVAPAAAPVTHVAAVSLAKLDPQISARLVRTARLRNLTPLKYLEQLLDRALPQLEDLGR